MAECELCGDGFYLEHEDLAPGGRFADWYENERELIRRGETIHDWAAGSCCPLRCPRLRFVA
jgi:hypothetical protein